MSPTEPASHLPNEAGAQGVRRVVALDGVRGLMTILVVLSHYFGEVPSGLPVLMVGWVAVDMFFVLSGYLVGRLILDKSGAANFLTVFYVRRACRTLPIYVLCVVAVFALLGLIDRPWTGGMPGYPLWAYLSFNQNVFMAARDAVGHPWLGPTWTMGLEEHFYLALPLLFLAVPRRLLAPVLCALALAAVSARTAILVLAPEWWMSTLVFLPTRLDILVCGVLAAIALSGPRASGPRLDLPLRIAAPALLVLACLLRPLGGGRDLVFQAVGPLVVSLGCAVFLATLVRGAPEAARFRSPFLCFFGTTSYAVYLMHMPVLGLMHGVLLGSEPDVASPAQWAVTVAAVPVCVALGWLLTRLVEAPISAYGRRWRWREDAAPAPNPTVAPA